MSENDIINTIRIGEHDEPLTYWIDHQLNNSRTHQIASGIASGWSFDGYILLPGWERTQETGGSTWVRFFSTDRAIVEDFVKHYDEDIV